MKHRDFRKLPPRNQRGAALMVSLVFLVIMTIIGIASMNTAVMENLMAASSKSILAAFSLKLDLPLR